MRSLDRSPSASIPLDTAPVSVQMLHVLPECTLLECFRESVGDFARHHLLNHHQELYPIQGASTCSFFFEPTEDLCHGRFRAKLLDPRAHGFHERSCNGLRNIPQLWFEMSSNPSCPRLPFEL